MPAAAKTFEEEVAGGERFEFGRNWSRFLDRLTVPQIKLAQASLVRLLGHDRLDGKTFLDVGSGSGLFSLVARRLGATVTSFDFDRQSVDCTRELKRRYFPDDPDWRIGPGSVLDDAFLDRLGRYDIVYSWGVLHHTGAMWAALDKVKRLVSSGGQLAIAIYNDQGEPTDRWAAIKRRYNRLPRPAAGAYAGWIVAKEEGASLRRHWREGTTAAFLDHWRHYAARSGRGMSRWHDWIDWIGGLPYERGTVERIADVYARDGFMLEQLVDRSTEYGCNEFVFRRVAEPGQFVEFRLPGGNSMARRFGQRVTGPFEIVDGMWHGRVHSCPTLPATARLLLFDGDAIVGPVQFDGLSVPLPVQASDAEDLASRTLHLVAAEEIALAGPFRHVEGNQWVQTVADLADLADTQAEPRRSSAYLFEDGKQLPLPHATHGDIARFGAGRFSHWGTDLYFSSLFNDDPNTSGRHYTVLAAARPLPAGRSAAIDYGLALHGPAVASADGWMAAFGPLPAEWQDAALHLVRDDRLVGQVVPDANGMVLVTGAGDPPPAFQDSAFSIVAGEALVIEQPILPERGSMWSAGLPQLTSIADTSGLPPRSPLYLFEDGVQLGFPHALHDDIARLGGGRFSHWESMLYFSSSDATEPGSNARTYTAIVCRPRSDPA